MRCDKGQWKCGISTITELIWHDSSDWLALWHFVRERGYLTPRKSRLIAVAACRELLHLVSDDRLVRMLELAEEWADIRTEPDDDWLDRKEDWCDEAEMAARITPDEVERTAAWAFAGLGIDEHKVGRVLESVAAVYGCPTASTGDRPSHCQSVARLIREAVGNPFRPVMPNPAWLTPTVVALATGIYDEKAFDRLPILADALEEAGCDSDDILNHCRSEGPHVKGCWAVDFVLGKN